MSISGYTTNYRLRKITFNSRGWHLDHWYNLDIIDGLIKQISNSSTLAFTSSVAGTGNAITLNFSPDITYTAGKEIAFIVANANTGAVTVDCDGLGAKSLVKAGGGALASGDLVVGQFVRAIYDGTKFAVIYPDLDKISALTKIGTGTSGATADTNADDFTIENSANPGMSILGPNGTNIRLALGHVSAPFGGGLRYDATTSRLYIRANNAEGPYMDSSKLIRQPDLPYFSAYATRTVAPAVPFTFDTYSTEIIDSLNAFNPTTGLFTAPVAGVYELEFQGLLASGGGYVDSNYGFFYKNGAQVGPQFLVWGVNSSGGICLISGKIMVSLAQNDTIGFRMVTWAGAGGSTPLMRYQFQGKLLP